MSFFSVQTETVRIDDEHVIVVRKPNYEERQKILLELAQNPDNQMLAGVAAMTMAARMLIYSWSGPGFEGRPVTVENIRLLPANIVDPAAKRALDFVTSGMSTDEKKESGAVTS